MSLEIWAQGDGHAALLDRPLRPQRPGQVRVRIAYSAVSWGTERVMLRNGFRGRLGYQASGFVVGIAGPGGALIRSPAPAGVEPSLPVGPDPNTQTSPAPTDRAQPGARVFAGGQPVVVYGAPYVGHAEELWVSPHLVAPLGEGVPLSSGAYAGLGAIALHAIRLTGLTLGCTALVAGLGMVGQWVVRLLALAGVRTVALDPLALRQAQAIRGGAEHALADPDDPSLPQWARALGRPDGRFDAVLLCMGTEDPNLLDRYIPLAAPGSALVVAGDVPISAGREALFQSEVRIVVSHAAGPGRGDPRYEADGEDYPLAHARWTEGRNLRAVADLLTAGRVDLGNLIGEPLSPQALVETYAAGPGPETIGSVVDWSATSAPSPLPDRGDD